MKAYENIPVQDKRLAIEDRPVFYYATLVSGVPFDEKAEREIEKVIMNHIDLVLNPLADPGKHGAIEADPLRIFMRKAS